MEELVDVSGDPRSRGCAAGRWWKPEEKRRGGRKEEKSEPRDNYLAPSSLVVEVAPSPVRTIRVFRSVPKRPWWVFAPLTHWVLPR